MIPYIITLALTFFVASFFVALGVSVALRLVG